MKGIHGASALVLLLGAGVVLRSMPSSAPAGPSPVVSANLPREARGPRFLLGTSTAAPPASLAYRFRWATKATGALADRAELAAHVSGSADVTGTLLVAVSAGTGGPRLTARLADVRVTAWEVGEMNLAEQDFGAGSAVLDGDKGGVLHDMAFSADVSPGAQLLLRTVVSHTVHRAEPSATTAADERTSIGTAATDFVWESPRVLRARRVRYLSLDAVPLVAAYTQEVRSHAEWTFAADGAPTRVREEEHVVVRAAEGATRFASDLSFALDRAPDDSRAVAARTTEPTTRVPIDGAESEQARHDRLVRRVDGLTEARLHDRITIASNGGGPETDAKLLFRATGLLLLEPGAAERLADRLLADRPGAETTGHGDELVVDLLTFAGDAPSQSALRRVLATPRVKAKGIYPLLVQRLGLLAAPTRETGVFCLTLAQAAQDGSDLAIGAHYTLSLIHISEPTRPY